MKRALLVAVAVVMSVLVVTVPAAASHQVVVVSQHTTDTDFNAASLTNMTVNGSGASATVEVEDPEVLNDSFGDLNGYTEVGITGDATWTAESGFARADITSAGAEALVNDSVTVRNATVEVQNVTLLGGANEQPGAVLAWQDSNNHVQIVLNGFNGALTIYQRVGGTRTTIANTSFNFVDDTAYNLVVTKDGQTVNATVYDQGGTELVTAEGTVDASLDASGQVGLFASGGAAALLSWSDLVVTSQDAGFGEDGEYIHTHDAENTEQGSTNLTTVTSATVCVTYRGDSNGDGSFDTLLNETCGITTTGNKTFTWSIFAGDEVQVNVSAEATGDDFALVMDDESVFAAGTAPTVDNSSASPTGTLSTADPTFEIDINDSDFPLSQGDTVTAELFVDGNSEGTDTLTANGTASVSATVSGGDHDYHWVATDEYGHSVQSQTFSISTPGNLTIRNETSPHGIVDGCTATVRIFEDVDDDPTIVERTDSDGDGNISLAGLPVDGEFTATMKCDGYHNRTIIIEDIFDQQSAFMLSTDRPSVESRFTIDDRTGDFPAEETELIIQKAINRSEYGGSPSGFSWTNVAGDDLGASEAFTTDLEEGDRYRIKVQNDDGDQRILGSHNADIEGTFNLVIGRVILDPEGTDQPAYTAERTNESGAPVRVTFEYNDSRENTTKIWLHIYEYGNQSNELLANTSFTPSSGNYGTFTNTEDVPAAENETTWVVEFTAEREDGLETVHGEIVVGPQRSILDLPDWLATVIFVGSILIVTGLFSQLNGHVGAVVIAALGALFYFAGVAPPKLGGGVVLLCLITAAVIFINESRGASI